MIPESQSAGQTMRHYIDVWGLLVLMELPLQGENAAASGVAIRAWFSNLVIAENANSPAPLGGGLPSFMFFHHLSFSEYSKIVEKLLARPISRIWGSLDAAGLSAGKFVAVSDGGRGRNDAQRHTFVPFI
jgi:hypothetical protein